MEDNTMIPMEVIKERKVEIIKDNNLQADSEKELEEKIKKEQEERKCLIQLIVVFVTWVFLIILLMRSERREIPKPKTSQKSSHKTSKEEIKPAHHNRKLQNIEPEENKENTPPNEDISDDNSNVKKKYKKKRNDEGNL